jgi:hypothetical protein
MGPVTPLFAVRARMHAREAVHPTNKLTKAAQEPQRSTKLIADDPSA